MDSIVFSNLTSCQQEVQRYFRRTSMDMSNIPTDTLNWDLFSCLKPLHDCHVQRCIQRFRISLQFCFFFSQNSVLYPAVSLKLETFKLKWTGMDVGKFNLHINRTNVFVQRCYVVVEYLKLCMQQFPAPFPGICPMCQVIVFLCNKSNKEER